MHNHTGRHIPRAWRTLFIALALFAMLSGAALPEGVRHAWAGQSGQTAQPAGLTSEVAAPLTSQNAQQTGQDQPAQPQPPAPGADGPIPAPAAVSEGKFRYFKDTGHFLRGIFFEYWETHGATPVLGLPITEAIMEDGMAVQYLERVRLEWHPEISSDRRQQVLLTRLGVVSTEQRGIFFERLPGGTSTPTSHFFEETGHNLSNAFFTFWLNNGGLAVFGYPISEEIVEVSPTDGRQYTVQYFERNRFEWHPENPPSDNVLLGLLGMEHARARQLDPLARVLIPYLLAGDEDLTDSPELGNFVDEELLPAVQALGRTPQFRWVPGLIVRNRIFVEFAEITEEGVAGAFVATYSRTRPYVIIVPERERGASVEALASVLAHEATHAGNVIGQVAPARSNCSVEEETRAYLNGLASWLVLKGDDALSARYESGSLENAINRSLRGFNNGQTTVTLDFDLGSARQFLREVYGSDCGE
ncbi:MAG TPA: hypothetical protein VF826_02085 [Chloroflexia bacterium]